MPVSQKTLNERSQQFSQTIHRLVISKLSDLGKKVNAAATGMRDAADSTDNGFETTSDIHLDFAAGRPVHGIDAEHVGREQPVRGRYEADARAARHAYP